MRNIILTCSLTLLLPGFIFFDPAELLLFSFCCVALLYILFFMQRRFIIPYHAFKTALAFAFSRLPFLKPGLFSLGNFYMASPVDKFAPTSNYQPTNVTVGGSLSRITSCTRVRRNDESQSVAARPIIFLLFFMAIVPACSKAQDPVFTQAFLSPIYLNPAATGTGQYDLRVSGIYRRQWWTIPSGMNYMAVSVDKYFPEISGGLGLIATRSQEGYLNRSGVYGSYAYNICGGTRSVADNGSAPKWFWTGGLQFGVAQARVNYSKLVFADQLNTDGYIPGSVSSAVPSLKNGRVFPDFAAGMFYNRNFNDNFRMLAGFSAHHINKPDESLTFSSDSVRSQLPVLWTGSLLFTHTNTNSTWSYSFGGIYYRQAGNTSLQAGVEVTQNEYDISLGLWYRGSTNFTPVNTFSVTLSINLAGGSGDHDKMRVGVAHDAEIGNKAYSYTAGSSELGFVWDHSTYNSDADNPCKPKISSLICPAASK